MKIETILKSDQEKTLDDVQEMEVFIIQFNDIEDKNPAIWVRLRNYNGSMCFLNLSSKYVWFYDFSDNQKVKILGTLDWKITL